MMEILFIKNKDLGGLLFEGIEDMDMILQELPVKN